MNKISAYKQEQPHYWQQAVTAFKHAVSRAKEEIKIHTHMCCYSSFHNYLHHIQNMYVDEITIEAVCSGLELLDVFKLESNTSGDDDCDCG